MISVTASFPMRQMRRQYFRSVLIAGSRYRSLIENRVLRKLARSVRSDSAQDWTILILRFADDCSCSCGIRSVTVISSVAFQKYMHSKNNKKRFTLSKILCDLSRNWTAYFSDVLPFIPKTAEREVVGAEDSTTCLHLPPPTRKDRRQRSVSTHQRFNTAGWSVTQSISA